MEQKDINQLIDPHQLKVFEESPVWNAFKSTILERIEIIRGEMESGVTPIVTRNPETGKTETKMLSIDYEGIKHRQGECVGLRYVLAVPQIIKELWKQDEENKKVKKEE